MQSISLFIISFVYFPVVVWAYFPTTFESMRKNFHSPEYKFTLADIPKAWILTNTDTKQQLAAEFRHQEIPSLVFSVRIDSLDRFPSEAPSLTKYLLYYARRYPKAGLEILNSPKRAIQGHFARLQIRNPESPYRQQQTLIWHPAKRLYIFGCRAKEDEFALGLRHCEELLSGLQWQL